MPAPLAPKLRAAILADIDAGELSRNATARKHGVSVSTVSRIADQEGRTDAFDRSDTENATKAKVADLAARRAELARLLLDDAFELRERARSAYTYYERGQLGPEKVTLDRPPLRETREAYTALGIAIDKSKHLLAQDSEAGGAAIVDQWLREMMGEAALNAAAQHG